MGLTPVPLIPSNNLSDLASVETAFANLGVAIIDPLQLNRVWFNGSTLMVSFGPYFNFSFPANSQYIGLFEDV